MATKTTKTSKTTKAAPPKPAEKKPAKPAAKAEPVQKNKPKAVEVAKPAPKAAPAKAVQPKAAASKVTTPKPPVKPETKPTKTEKTTTKQPVKPATPEKIIKPEQTKPATVSSQKWTEIRKILLTMKEQTLREIAKSIKSGSELNVGEEPTGDIYDQASSERDRELGLLLNDREREKLHNIDEALLRIDDGDYGVCEECDEDIPLGRLKVLPFTRHCVKCKSDIERLQAQTLRME